MELPENMTMGDIAKYLNVGYQHVRRMRTRSVGLLCQLPEPTLMVGNKEYLLYLVATYSGDTPLVEVVKQEVLRRRRKATNTATNPNAQPKKES